MEFHSIGLNDFAPGEVFIADEGDEANLGRASFTKREEDTYRFKVPQLYNLKDSPFYGHGGSFTSIRDLIAYKVNAKAENPLVEEQYLSSYFTPLDLNEEEIDLLTAFIESGLYDANLNRYVPEQILSGACLPNNDWMSRSDLGCE